MEEIDEVEITKKCRACFCDEDEETSMHCLYSEFDQGYSLADLLKDTMHPRELNLDPNNGMPLNLCENCTHTVVDFYNLKIRYEETEDFMKELLKNAGKNSRNSENEPKDKSTEVPKKDSECSSSHSKSSGSPSRTAVSNNDKKVKNNSEDKEPSPKAKRGRKKKFANTKVTNADDVTDDIEGPSRRNTTKISRLLYEGACRDSLVDSEDGSFELQETKRYSCPECTKYFFDLKFFQKHLADEHKDGIFQPDDYSTIVQMQVRKTVDSESNTCLICKAKFANNQELKAHMSAHKSFMCEDCGAGFLKKSYLTDHRQVHQSTRGYACPYCDKRFQRRTVLVKHKRIHTNPNQNVCEVCGRGFTDRGALSTHIKLLHIGDRNFKCTICGQSFPLRSTLQKHILRHTKDRESVYNCEECSMSYKDKSSLTRHYFLKHSGKSKFTCPYCKNDFAEGSSLKRHIITKHCKDPTKIQMKMRAKSK